MPFVLICRDRPGSAEIRTANRDAHLAYAADHPILIGGPLLDDEGAMIGSLLILDVAERAAAEAFAAGDREALADLCESVQIRPWRRVIS